jgi:hypothetical protein
MRTFESYRQGFRGDGFRGPVGLVEPAPFRMAVQVQMVDPVRDGGMHPMASLVVYSFQRIPPSSHCQG